MEDFSIVVACDDARGIGKEGDLPWHVPADLAHFRRTTQTAPEGLRNAVIMGRTTWESIPPRFRPLAGRINIVMSRQQRREGGGAQWVHSLPEALDAAVDLGAHAVFSVGGAMVYEHCLEHRACRSLIITRISGDYGCDRFFPRWQDWGFVHAAELGRGTSKGVGYRIQKWQRQ